MTPDEVQQLVAWTPLHRAAFRGDVDAARALLDGGADVDPRALDGWTPLMSACLEGHAAVARLLRERGAQAELPDARLAVLASASGDVDTARVFFPERMFFGSAALFFLAAHARAGHGMQKLTDAGESDGDMVGYSSSWNERWAVQAPLALDDDVMAYLADTVTPMADGLHVGHIDVARRDGTDALPAPPPGLCGGYAGRIYIADLAPHLLGDRPLTTARLRELLVKAVHAGHVDVVDALLPETGKAPAALFTAILTDDPALVARLVDNPDVRESEGPHPRLSALGVAARYAKPRAASVLLEKGAHVERGSRRDSPLLLAVENTGPAALDVVTALLEHGANVEALHGAKGWTPLMRAALMGDAKIVERLLRAGANANARDKHGMTPMRHANVGASIKKADHDEIVELLLGFGAVREP